MSSNKNTQVVVPSTIPNILLTKEAVAMEMLFTSTLIHNMGEGPTLPTISKAVWSGYFK